MRNGDVIDGPDYYRLPCGRQLEDFIWERGLSFFAGSALKYRYRAGRKDGESAAKDLAKASHFAAQIARRRGRCLDYVQAYVVSLVHDARTWDGSPGGRPCGRRPARRVRTWRPGDPEEGGE